MKNCIVLGSGRSGTSMIAGTLATCGYFMGEKLYKPRAANPKGFFESPDINNINEDLLAQVVPKRPPLVGRWCCRERPTRRQRWLARVPLGERMTVTPRLAARMEPLVAREPFCFKDPRFCYTLPVWRPYLKGASYVCVFRHPAVTAASILRECANTSYLRSLRMDFDTALDVWRHMYEHVLRVHRCEGDWLFIHFDQMFDGSAFARLESFLDVRVNRRFPDAALSRTAGDKPVPTALADLYEELCDLAGKVPDV